MKDWKKIIKIIFGTILLYIFHPNGTFKYLIDYLILKMGGLKFAEINLALNLATAPPPLLQHTYK